MVPSSYPICACHVPNCYRVLAMFLLAVLTQLVIINCYHMLKLLPFPSGVIPYFLSTAGA